MTHPFDDANMRELTAITGFTRLPEYVAQYQAPKVASMHDGDYADDSARRYPLDSKAATWLSAAYFSLRKAAGAPEAFRGEHTYVMANIKRAAAAYGIEADVSTAITAISEGVDKQKTAAQIPDDAFGLVTQDAAGTPVRRFPMLDAEGVRKAASVYEARRGSVPWGQRTVLAGNVLRKAAQFGVPNEEIPDLVWSDARKGVSTPTMVADELAKRAVLLADTDSDMAETLSKIALVVLDTPAVEYGEDQAAKLAELLERVDTSCNLTARYADVLSPPSVVAFAIPLYKAAAMCADEVTVNGKRMKIAALALVPPAVYHAALGDTASQAVGDAVDATKLAGMLRGLSPEQQAALDCELRATLEKEAQLGTGFAGLIGVIDGASRPAPDSGRFGTALAQGLGAELGASGGLIAGGAGGTAVGGAVGGAAGASASALAALLLRRKLNAKALLEAARNGMNYGAVGGLGVGSAVGAIGGGIAGGQHGREKWA